MGQENLTVLSRMAGSSSHPVLQSTSAYYLGSRWNGAGDASVDDGQGKPDPHTREEIIKEYVTRQRRWINAINSRSASSTFFSACDTPRGTYCTREGGVNLSDSATDWSTATAGPIQDLRSRCPAARRYAKADTCEVEPCHSLVLANLHGWCDRRGTSPRGSRRRFVRDETKIKTTSVLEQNISESRGCRTMQGQTRDIPRPDLRPYRRLASSASNNGSRPQYGLLGCHTV